MNLFNVETARTAILFLNSGSVSWKSEALANAPLHHCITAPLHHCTTAPLHHCTTAPLHQNTTMPTLSVIHYLLLSVAPVSSSVSQELIPLILCQLYLCLPLCRRNSFLWSCVSCTCVFLCVAGTHSSDPVSVAPVSSSVSQELIPLILCQLHLCLPLCRRNSFLWSCVSCTCVFLCVAGTHSSDPASVAPVSSSVSQELIPLFLRQLHLCLPLCRRNSFLWSCVSCTCVFLCVAGTHSSVPASVASVSSSVSQELIPLFLRQLHLCLSLCRRNSFLWSCVTFTCVFLCVAGTHSSDPASVAPVSSSVSQELIPLILRQLHLCLPLCRRNSFICSCVSCTCVFLCVAGTHSSDPASVAPVSSSVSQEIIPLILCQLHLCLPLCRRNSFLWSCVSCTCVFLCVAGTHSSDPASVAPVSSSVSQELIPLFLRQLHLCLPLCRRNSFLWSCVSCTCVFLCVAGTHSSDPASVAPVSSSVSQELIPLFLRQLHLCLPLCRRNSFLCSCVSCTCVFLCVAGTHSSDPASVAPVSSSVSQELIPLILRQLHLCLPLCRRNSFLWSCVSCTCVFLSLCRRNSFLWSCISCTCVFLSLCCRNSFLWSCVSCTCVFLSLCSRNSFLWSCVSCTWVFLSLCSRNSFLWSCVSCTCVFLSLCSRNSFLWSCVSCTCVFLSLCSRNSFLWSCVSCTCVFLSLCSRNSFLWSCVSCTCVFLSLCSRNSFLWSCVSCTWVFLSLCRRNSFLWSCVSCTCVFLSLCRRNSFLWSCVSCTWVFLSLCSRNSFLWSCVSCTCVFLSLCRRNSFLWSCVSCTCVFLSLCRRNSFLWSCVSCTCVFLSLCRRNSFLWSCVSCTCVFLSLCRRNSFLWSCVSCTCVFLSLCRRNSFLWSCVSCTCVFLSLCRRNSFLWSCVSCTWVFLSLCRRNSFLWSCVSCTCVFLPLCRRNSFLWSCVSCTCVFRCVAGSHSSDPASVAPVSSSVSQELIRLILCQLYLCLPLCRRNSFLWSCVSCTCVFLCVAGTHSSDPVSVAPVSSSVSQELIPLILCQLHLCLPLCRRNSFLWYCVSCTCVFLCVAGTNSSDPVSVAPVSSSVSQELIPLILRQLHLCLPLCRRNSFLWSCVSCTCVFLCVAGTHSSDPASVAPVSSSVSQELIPWSCVSCTCVFLCVAGTHSSDPASVAPVSSSVSQELIPLILCAATLHPDSTQRDQLLNILFNLIKRPDKEQRLVLARLPPHLVSYMCKITSVAYNSLETKLGGLFRQNSLWISKSICSFPDDTMGQCSKEL